MLINYERKNFKLSFDSGSINFFINKEKKTVVCTVEGVFQTAIMSDFAYVPHKYFCGKGVAKCHEDDDFDIERGKRIALSKAENNAFSKAIEYATLYINAFQECSAEINKFISKANHTIKHNKSYMDSISDENHPRYKKDLKKMVCGKEKIHH